MELSRVKDYYSAGAITGAIIHFFPISGSWSIEFEFRPGTYHGGTETGLDTQRGKLRQFKTADAALRVLREIGLERATVHLPH